MSASAMEGLPAAPTPSSAVFAVLQRIGRSLMMPITVLPPRRCCYGWVSPTCWASTPS